MTTMIRVGNFSLGASPRYFDFSRRHNRQCRLSLDIRNSPTPADGQLNRSGI